MLLSYILRSKTSLFGSGTYLSHELGMSLLYSPAGLTWEHSAFGPSLSCLALAEIINHPSVKVTSFFTIYLKCNFPMNHYVRLSVSW